MSKIKAYQIEYGEIIKQFVEIELSIEKTLIRRGYQCSKSPSLFERLLVPWEKKALDGLYTIMTNHENRAKLKNICSIKNEINPNDLCKKAGWSSERINAFIKDLISFKILRDTTNISSFSLFNQQAEFGANLEWYIAEIFQRELYYTSGWGIHIEEAPDGGDYDVVARAEDKIIYVECKAKPVKNITKNEFLSFFRRDNFLRPDLSIFFIDSNDSLNPLIESLKELTGTEIRDNFFNDLKEMPLKHIGGRLFLINTQRESIKQRIMECLRFNHRFQTHYMSTEGPFFLHKNIEKII